MADTIVRVVEGHTIVVPAGAETLNFYLTGMENIRDQADAAVQIAIAEAVANLPAEFEGPQGPAGSISIDDLPITVIPCAADGVTDDTAIINATLADADVSIAMLPAGTIMVTSSVRVPSGKTLMGAGVGRTTIKAKTGFSKTVYKGVVVAPETSATNVTLRDFTVDGNKLYHAAIVHADNRIHGVLFERNDGFAVRDVNIRNCTGYGHYCAGTFDGSNSVRNGYYENCHVKNCNVNFEIQDGGQITYAHCHSTTGDGDMGLESHFHPYLRCSKITYRDCTAAGTGSGWNLLNITGDQNDITIDNCRAVITTANSALLVSGPFYVNRLKIANSSFVSDVQTAASIEYITDGKISNCEFIGKANGSAVFGVAVGATAQVYFSNCHAKGESLAAGVIGAGITNASTTSRWSGGLLEGVGTLSTAMHNLPIKIDAMTLLVPAAGNYEQSGVVNIDADGANSTATITLDQAVSNQSLATLETSIRSVTGVHLGGSAIISHIFTSATEIKVFISGANLSAHELAYRYREEAS